MSVEKTMHLVDPAVIAVASIVIFFQVHPAQEYCFVPAMGRSFVSLPAHELSRDAQSGARPANLPRHGKEPRRPGATSLSNADCDLEIRRPKNERVA